MSSQDSKSQDVPEAAPSVADTEGTNQEEGTMPVPITDEDGAQSPDRPEQSWENFDSEQQAEPEQVSENPSSAFSDSSDESPAQSPTDPNQESVDDLFSDDEEDRPPPPRPATPLAPSALEKDLEEHRKPVIGELDMEQGQLDSKGINNHWNSQRKERQHQRTYNFKPSQSSMSLVLQPSSETASGFTVKDTDNKGRVPPTQIPLPDSPEDSRNDYEELEHDAEPSEPERLDQPADEVSADIQFETEPLQLSPQDWTSGSASGEAATTAADIFDRELEEAAERNRQNQPQDEEDALPTLDDTPLDYGAAEQVDITPAGSQEQPSRPASPITGFYDPEDLKDYYQTPEEQEAEFDDLMKDESVATPGIFRRSSSDYDGESSETPPTPTSAEILEQVTGISPGDGRYRFDRLARLAKSTVMRDPQRSLKMQRYMLQIIKGTENGLVAQIGEDGSDVKVKAKTAWAAAAAHHYRSQRDDARDERERARQISWEWETWGKRQHEKNNALSAENDALSAEYHDMEEGYQRAREDLDQAELEKSEAERKAQEARDEVQAVKDAGAAREKRLSGLEARAKQIMPLWNRKMWLEKNPPKDVDTQTSPTLSQSEQATQTQQTEEPSSEDKVDTQADAETGSAALSEEDQMNAMVDEGTQTVPGTTNAESQGRTRATAVRMDVPRLPFRLTREQRTLLLPEIVQWINQRHVDERGDPEVPAVTSDRIEALLDTETTYNDFVSALLETDRLLFRPDHLARFIEGRINHEVLGLTPLAILQFLHPVAPRSMGEDLTAIYSEIAHQQVQINQLENSFARDRAIAVAPMNSDPEALEEMRNHIAGLGGDLEDASWRAFNANNRARTAEENIEELKKQNDAVAIDLAETQQLLDEALNQRNKTPSPTTTSPAKSDDADNEKADKLESELNACREHGEQLQKCIDDADSEKEKLKVNLNECRIHGEELKAAKEQLERDVAHWKAEYDEMERRKLQSDGTAIAYQMKYEPVPDLSDSEDGKDEDEGEGEGPDHEMAQLRAEIERLKTENERLNTVQDQSEPTNATNAPSAEVDALKQENESLRRDNARYNDMLNAAASLNRKAQTLAKPAPIATNLPLRTTNNLQTPAAIPLPATPSPPPGGGAAGAALPTDNLLLRPSDARTPRTAAPPLPPINASSMPERWLARERKIQSTNAFWENKRKILRMIEERDLQWEGERKLDRARADREAERRVGGLGVVS